MHPPVYDEVHEWLTRTVNRLGVDGGCFHLKSCAGDRIVCQAITNAYAATHLSYGLDLTDCPAITQVFETGESLAIDDAAGDTRVAQVARERFGLKSILYCPVTLTGRRDAVAVFSFKRPHSWAEGEGRLAEDAVRALQTKLTRVELPAAVNSSSYELMLGAVSGLVSIVDRNLLTLGTSSAVASGLDVEHQSNGISVDELLKDSDRGHELRSALTAIVNGDLDRFQGLFRTTNGIWWVHARGAPSNGRTGPSRLAVVHAQPLPAASGTVVVKEEQNRLQALGRIAGTVAHEVNNALQQIGMNVEEIDSDAHRSQRDAIQMATRRAARVTSQLLTFARRAPSEFVRVELTELVGQRLDLARNSVGSDHYVSLRLRGRAHVLADIRKIELALINLCRNAADASPAGTDVIIEAGMQRRDGQEWGVLAVVDVGSGMPPDVANSLGELQMSTKAEGLGSGIGLAVVKQVADEHSGQVVISTGDIGTGTRVAVFLPMVGADLNQGTDSGEGGTRILVVDDEVDIARLVSRSMNSKGYRTRSCSSLSAARALFDEEPDWAELVIFDINLGDGNGVDLFAHARAVRSDLRFLAISGFADHDTAVPLARANCRLLSKPFTPDQLLAEVERVLATADASG